MVAWQVLIAGDDLVLSEKRGGLGSCCIQKAQEWAAGKPPNLYQTGCGFMLFMGRLDWDWSNPL